jgi:hypothetical protein
MSTSPITSSIRRAMSCLVKPYNLPWRRSISRPVCLPSIDESCSATPIRNRMSSGWEPTSKPATVAVPDVMPSRVHSILTVVDLPAPLGPRNP